MVEEKEIMILKKSIVMLDDFTRKADYVNSGREFIAIHNRNTDTIEKLARERQSNYLKNKIQQYPKISVQEVDDYIKRNRKDVSIVFVIFSAIGAHLIYPIFRMIKNKGNTPAMIKSKILKIAQINSDIIKVIENPFLEEIHKSVG